MTINEFWELSAASKQRNLESSVAFVQDSLALSATTHFAVKYQPHFFISAVKYQPFFRCFRNFMFRNFFFFFQNIQPFLLIDSISVKGPKFYLKTFTSSLYLLAGFVASLG
jgi:hypothetical protein